MTIAEQEQYLGTGKLKVLEQLHILLPDMQLTGSISLFEYDCIKRDINDIDIVVSEDLGKVGRRLEAFYSVDYSVDYGDEMQQIGESSVFVRGVIPNRIFFEVGAVKVCVFYGTNQEHKLCSYLSGVIKVSHPRYAIRAKLRYLADLDEVERSAGGLTEFQKNKRTKHATDIAAFCKKFDLTANNFANFVAELKEQDDLPF